MVHPEIRHVQYITMQLEGPFGVEARACGASHLQALQTTVTHPTFWKELPFCAPFHDAGGSALSGVGCLVSGV